jgi:hypothetical protein
MPPIVLEVLRSPGRPLDDESRRFFEPRLNHEFGRVRIHIGSKAEDSTKALNALAFTSGEKIVLGEKVSKDKKAASRTLAHELVHVVQQRDAVLGGELEIDDTNSPSEREARKLSDDIISGLPAAVNHSFSGIQKDNGDEEERLRLAPTSQPQLSLGRGSLGWPGIQQRPEYQLELDPSIRAQMDVMQLLDPDSIRRSMLQLDYSTFVASQPPPWLRTPSTTAAQPSQPLVPREAGPSEPRQATIGDFFRALVRVPAVDSALTSLRTEASGQARHVWHELSTGERVILLSQTALIGGGTLAGILSSSEARQFALEQLQGRDVPVPGVPGLTFQLNLAGQERRVMFNLNLGRLLPPSLGFH